VYALEAIEVHRPRRIEAGCLDWLTSSRRTSAIGYSIYVYRVDREAGGEVAAETAQVPFWKQRKSIGTISR
jgi:hypothetical protein